MRRGKLLVVAALMVAMTATTGKANHGAGDEGEPPAPSPCPYPKYTDPNGISLIGHENTWAHRYWCETPWLNGIAGAGFVNSPAGSSNWVYTADRLMDNATGTISFDHRLNPGQPTGACTNPGDTGAQCWTNGQMVGPAGIGVNDFVLDNPITGIRGFDFDRPSFTQDVRVAKNDFINVPGTPANGGDDVIYSDYDLSSFAHPHAPSTLGTFNDVNLDGGLNFYKFGWTTPEGTQFKNMQIDRAGNYFVAKRDMQWGWFDKLHYVGMDGTDNGELDSQFNIQPYPISNAYGWCGVLNGILDPDSNQPMAGQLTFDVAFDAYPYNTSPAKNARPFTVVVPGFVMRSYGKAIVDITRADNGVHQHFEFTAKPNNVTPDFRTIYKVTGGVPNYFAIRDDGVNHVNPVTGLVENYDPVGYPGLSSPDAVVNSVAFGDSLPHVPWTHWKNFVMAFGAGVVPVGAWVTNEGTPNMRVVDPLRDPPDVVAGATWHSNGPFAGAAFLVRGDMYRKASFTRTDNRSDYIGDIAYSAWSDYPAPAGYTP